MDPPGLCKDGVGVGASRHRAAALGLKRRSKHSQVAAGFGVPGDECEEALGGATLGVERACVVGCARSGVV